MRELWAPLCLALSIACLLARRTVQACEGRTYFNTTYGVITDGVGNYREASHCEWLIEAPGNHHYITLEFISMETECAYDYLFIYDGNSYQSPLLGSFSGATLPDKVLATSGQMLIYFFSDRNYVRIGFHANYSTTECPHNCSNHGVCNTLVHLCACFDGFYGSACELEYCKNDCGTHGSCSGLDGCVCEQGYLGDSCNFSLTTPKSKIGGWSLLYPAGSGFSARSGHAGVFLPSSQCLYIFGGQTLVSLLDDLVRFCVAGYHSNRWETLITEDGPSGRHGHAMAAFGDSFFMFGGIMAGQHYSDELWKFNTQSVTWHLLDVGGGGRPLGLASMTLTAVENWLYLLGGQSEKEEFAGDMYRINMSAPAAWEKVLPIGGKPANRSLTGHSAVYHPESKSIFIFGGFTHDYARFPKRTNHLYAFHVDKKYWSQIHYGLTNLQEPPLERAFHSASIIGNYMVIVGGNAHIHHEAEVCFDGDVYFYHLTCHRWLQRKTLEEPFPGTATSPGAPKGRFSHVAAVINESTILVAGGYRGNVLGDLMAYTVPDPVLPNASREETAEPCVSLTSKALCILDRECAWCRSQNYCVHKSQTQICQFEVDRGYCPGICAALHDCGSCTVHGQQTLSSKSVSSECVWCVKEHQCQTHRDLTGACNATQPQLLGWWVNTGGNTGSNDGGVLSSLEQCRLHDIPAGLHLVQYRYPPNFTNPDEVSLIRETRWSFQFTETSRYPVSEPELARGGNYTVHFRGFIHPLGVRPNSGDPHLQIFLKIAAGHASLNISTDATVANQEEVASLTAQGHKRETALRADDRPIFPHEERGYKYYMSALGSQKIAEKSGMSQVASVLRMEWTATVENSEHSFSTLTAEFLEPYRSGACEGYVSCLACLTDVSCGWCPTSQSCILRTATELPAEFCGVVEGAQHLVFNQSACPVCSDHLECRTCTEDPLCEWLTTEARCMRRGRFPDALRDPETCPSPCYMRKNCSWCIADENECAWCEHTQTCFPFMGYILRHSYGGCTHWVDSISSQQCHDCSRHSTCKTCLREYQCGWCGHVDNPMIGRCLHGDFTGPDTGDVCASLIADVHNTSQTEPSDWSYGVCPDVEECRLGYHDCHENATCINTFDSFLCECNRGFEGDGTESCEPTCYYDCVHGDCSGFPKYECLCDLGWTGLDCNTNCGCNNHSYCVTALGQCDECEDHTRGLHCEMCDHGSYGDATSDIGCMPCPCNGHGDPTRGLCNNVTGLCYCRDNTYGDQCERCKDGYYGDPRNNGKCYLQCTGRSILGNITSGYLGTHAGIETTEPEHDYCLWILTVYESIDSLRMLDVMPTITFTMETDIKTICNRDFVYVFDGIPSFTSSDPSTWAPLLAAYCGYGASSPRSVEATSGYLTVYYEASVQGTSTAGFNASYHVNSCPSSCHGNRRCRGSHCDCLDGFSGVDCAEEICPGNCGKNHDHGQCDLELGYCDCHYGYGDTSCNKTVTTDSAVYLPLNDPWRRDGIGAFRSPRARLGHSLVTCDQQNLYLFGGRSFMYSHVTEGILWKYNIMTDIWEKITPTTTENPTNRYFHGAVCLPSLHAMYIFGGLVMDENGKVEATNDTWKFYLDSYRWEKVRNKGTPLPPMAGHTMTAVDATKVLVIGGFSSTFYFNHLDYQLDASKNGWEKMRFSGVKPTGIFAHSTVFHSASNTLYVFGGYEYLTDSTILSGHLYALDLRKERWSVIPPSHGSQPLPRVWHTAVSMDDYLVVMGGGTSNTDFDGSVWAYRYSCNDWMEISPGALGVIGSAQLGVRGAAALSINNKIYHVGGYNGLIHATLTRIQLPFDLCSLLPDALTCDGTLGCNRCSVRETNDTYCYDNSGSRPAGCQIQNTTIIIQKNKSCDKDLVNERPCSHHKTCRECLARWPAHEDHHDVCKWCSNCPTGACVRIEADCERANPCQLPQLVIRSAVKCVEQQCQASDCDKCWQQGVCMWTRQFKRSSEVSRTLFLSPTYSWNCLKKSLLNATDREYNIESAPPNMCPRRCAEFTTCEDCLEASGAEGGYHECYWSLNMQECMPPAYLPLRCLSGSCGHIESGPPTRCPQSCTIHTQCSTCLRAPGCGWCAFGGLNGRGICMEGGLMAPLRGACVQGNITHGHGELTDSQRLWLRHSMGSPMWSFTQCPSENECLNGHHSCGDNEDCTNLHQWYRCDCKTGYRRDNKTGLCVPHCTEGCEPNGVCIHPNICRCNFGFVGHNCMFQCQCNGHSDCLDDKNRDNCLSCHNNTMGNQCSMCKPLYVGNPVNNSACRSCLDVCNHHSPICLSEQDLNRTIIHRRQPLDLQNVTRASVGGFGATNESKVMCWPCGNNTMGRHCEECKPGYYRQKTKLKTEPCELCQCHGHSDTCDKDTGTNCECKNNTQSPRCDASIPDKKCDLIQCSECKDNFLGTPTQGHQCYRQMTVDHDYCFDPVTQSDCYREPEPLLPGRTVFFAVQPKYLNVHIRVTIDVTVGAVNLFLANLEDAFVVEQDLRTGGHVVHLDTSVFSGDFQEILDLPRQRRSTHHSAARRVRRDDDDDDSSRDDDLVDESYFSQNHTGEPDRMYAVKLVDASGINTFVTLDNVSEILAVRNLQNRLVITLPSHIHELKKTRFFVVIQGVGNSGSNETRGMMFFRQDQLHIDLFVFFSVFFSSFFLFLDLCVLVWKIKQAVDTQRTRHRRQVEMQSMASRPFGKTIIVTKDEAHPTQPTSESQGLLTMRKTSAHRMSIPKMASKYSLGTTNMAFHRTTDEMFHVNPIALEPMDDGVAAIGTFFFELPGGKNTPVKACLGSTLLSMRVMYPNGHHGNSLTKSGHHRSPTSTL